MKWLSKSMVFKTDFDCDARASALALRICCLLFDMRLLVFVYRS